MHHNFTLRLFLKWIFIVQLLVFFSTKSNAQIIYTDVNPDYTLNSSGNGLDSFNIDFDQDGIKEGTVYKFYEYYAASQFSNLEMSVCADSNFVAIIQSTFPIDGPIKFNFGDSIGSGCNWLLTGPGGGYEMARIDLDWTGLGCNTYWGSWDNATGDNYLGVKFLKGGQYKYGWIRIYNTNIIKDFAYDDSGNTILAGVTSVTGLPEEIYNNKISVYPNPCFSTLRIAGIKEPGIINIYDISGRIVLSKTINNINENSLDIAMLPSGIYSLNYLVGNKNSVIRFVKEE